jgi:hypothetical protein
MTKSLKKSSVGDTIGREAILDIRKGGNMGKTLSKAEQELLDSLPDDAKALISEIQKDHDEELQELADLLPDEDDEADDDSEEAILGKADPAVLAIIQKSRDEAAEATKIAKTERDMRIDREMLAKAADYKNITGTPQEKAELLKAAFAVSEDFGKKLEQTFKAVNAQLDAATDIFSPIGKTAGLPDSIYRNELEAKVAEFRKADPTLSPEKAMDKAMQADPKLYDRYLEEKEGRRS